MILSDPNIVQPDIMFIASDRTAGFSNRGFEGAPTLVVEVLSLSTGGIDRKRKLEIYARHGVPYYWIVDPVGRTIDVPRLTGRRFGRPKRFGGDRLADLPPFPGLVLDPIALWP